jgi:hypothetical protein
MDLEPKREPKERIEQILWVLGGCEVIMRSNASGKFGAYPPLARQVQKIQQDYTERLTRLAHGLPEKD